MERHPITGMTATEEIPIRAIRGSVQPFPLLEQRLDLVLRLDVVLAQSLDALSGIDGADFLKMLTGFVPVLQAGFGQGALKQIEDAQLGCPLAQVVLVQPAGLHLENILDIAPLPLGNFPAQAVPF